MKTRTWIVASLFGVVLGAGLVIACSDDSPGDADAAVCDCPAAEPPLAGRIVAVKTQGEIAANSGGAVGAQCAPGATILGGGCSMMTPDNRVVLREARIDRTVPAQPTYVCEWASPGAPANTGFAEAICLMPAQ